MKKLIQTASVYRKNGWKTVKYIGWYTRHNGLSRPVFPFGFVHNEGGDAGWSWSIKIDPFKWKFFLFISPSRFKWWICVNSSQPENNGFFRPKN